MAGRATSKSVPVINLQEEIVLAMVGELFAERPEICQCAQCRADTQVYALNRLPPKYVATSRGRAISRVEGTDIDSRVRVASAVARAIRLISKNPNHA